MAHINLLPWREEQRREQLRQFATMAGLSVLLTLAIVFLIHMLISKQIDYQNLRNATLQNEINTLNASLKQIADLEDTKEQLLSRMDIIQSLQQKRPQVVHLFDEIVRTVPEGIYLTSIVQNGDTLTIKGVAESNGRVSAYMRNIDASDWLGTPKLQVIETRKGTLRSSNFTLITSQTFPHTEEDDANGGNEG